MTLTRAQAVAQGVTEFLTYTPPKKPRRRQKRRVSAVRGSMAMGTARRLFSPLAAGRISKTRGGPVTTVPTTPTTSTRVVGVVSPSPSRPKARPYRNIMAAMALSKTGTTVLPATSKQKQPTTVTSPNLGARSAISPAQPPVTPSTSSITTVFTGSLGVDVTILSPPSSDEGSPVGGMFGSNQNQQPIVPLPVQGSRNGKKVKNNGNQNQQRPTMASMLTEIDHVFTGDDIVSLKTQMNSMYEKGKKEMEALQKLILKRLAFKKNGRKAVKQKVRGVIAIPGVPTHILRNAGSRRHRIVKTTGISGPMTRLMEMTADF